MKKIIYSLLILSVIILSIFFYFKGNIDEIVRQLIIQETSNITETEVDLKAVKLDFKEGSGQLIDFHLGNPVDFTTKHAFHFDDAEIEINISSVTKETIIIEKVFISGAEVIYENKDGVTNFIALKNTIEKNIKSKKSSRKDNSDPGSNDSVNKDTKKQKKIIIKSFEMINSKVEAVMPFVSSQTISVSLPNLIIKDIGVKEKGLLPGELLNVFIKSIERDLVRAINFNDLVRDLEKNIKSIESDVKGKIKDIESQIKKSKDLKDIKKLKNLL